MPPAWAMRLGWRCSGRSHVCSGDDTGAPHSVRSRSTGDMQRVRQQRCAVPRCAGRLQVDSQDGAPQAGPTCRWCPQALHPGPQLQRPAGCQGPGCRTCRRRMWVSCPHTWPPMLRPARLPVLRAPSQTESALGAERECTSLAPGVQVSGAVQPRRQWLGHHGCAGEGAKPSCTRQLPDMPGHARTAALTIQVPRSRQWPPMLRDGSETSMCTTVHRHPSAAARTSRMSPRQGRRPPAPHAQALARAAQRWTAARRRLSPCQSPAGPAGCWPTPAPQGSPRALG